ncbi:hypothetical protein HKBW3S34_00804 [Candidatus Hakubella thermalkaliphila]|uniref:Uncharacterized protein n=2 Tax=Candidatus Hakubella thermalkaliphila TaxID=2754717 RepID=A0A6V8PE17_9ACTN|nr:hypothetical protein HKBW3S34_00804 [Candidatus Hakubella thermalkaliphila]
MATSANERSSSLKEDSLNTSFEMIYNSDLNVIVEEIRGLRKKMNRPRVFESGSCPFFSG